MICEVIGRLPFCGYLPGEIFEANLDPAAQARAIQRRNIRVISTAKPTLQPGTVTFPRDWNTPEPTKEG